MTSPALRGSLFFSSVDQARREQAFAPIPPPEAPDKLTPELALKAWTMLTAMADAGKDITNDVLEGIEAKLLGTAAKKK